MKTIYFFLLKLLIAGLLAAGLSLLWDRFWFQCGIEERFRVEWLAPFGEEIIKFGLAAGWSLPFFPLYGFFGLWEGIYEATRDRKNVLKHLGAGVLTHLLFGVAYFLPFSAWFQLGCAFLLHTTWNHFILLINRRFHG